MKVLVVGGGGREHAIVTSLSRSPEITKLYCAPGNGGIAGIAECVEIAATDVDKIVGFCVGEHIDFVAVIPDDPLALGMVDALEEKGVPCFGPRADAAQIEASKVFAKDLMKKYSIPTAAYNVFTDPAEASDFIRANNKFPIVIKADGLALGKGVIIAEDIDTALSAVDSMMNQRVFGDSGSRVVVEEYLTGPEVSVLAFTDGKTLVPMVSSMDHKRAGDGDTGLNTGGMGTIAPNPYYTPEVAARCMDEIFIPTIRAMRNEGRPFSGCLYFGLMITPDGPKVIEYNCRFGDPETQVVLPLLESDLFEIMRAVRNGTLDEVEVKFSDKYACCVVAASEGYPVSYKKGFPVKTGDVGKDVYVFHAGTKLDPEKGLVTSGGRVLGVTAVADTLGSAIDKAYKGLDAVSFENKYYRHDIGARAMLKK